MTETSPPITRRATLGLGAGAAAVALLARAGAGFAAVEDAKAAVEALLGGRPAREDGLTLEAPEIAENGAAVPVEVEVDSPMSDDDYVKWVTFIAEGNPNPGVATFHFTPKSGVASASTRMRLARTQNLVAIAELSSGDVLMTAREVKVTIGGCGG